METINSLRDKIRRIEYSKTPYKLLIDLITESRERAEEYYKEFKNTKKELKDILSILIKKEIVKKLPYNNKEKLRKFSNIPTAGIDGSRQIIGGALGRYYILLSAGISNFPSGINKECLMEYSDVKIISYTDPAGELVFSIGEDLMLELETKAIYHYINNLASKIQECYLLLDGPLVDPPRFPIGGGKKYIEYRSKALLNCIQRDPKIFIIGYNKRVMGNYFNKYIERELDRKLNITSDFDFLSLLFLILRHKVGSNYIFYTKPIRITDIVHNQNIYKEYEKNGVDIYSFYASFGPINPVFKVDFIPSLEEEEEDKILQKVEDILLFLRTSTYPEMRYPLQIITAHEKISIRKGVAEILYNEIITRVHSSDEELMEILPSYIL